jgi:hypothetical protein
VSTGFNTLTGTPSSLIELIRTDSYGLYRADTFTQKGVMATRHMLARRGLFRQNPANLLTCLVVVGRVSGAT